MKKRMLSLLLALVMVLSVLTAAVMAKGVQTFADVKESDWFYDAVCYVTDNGLMNGTGRGFAPQQTTSRAMLWEVLSRVDGQNAKRNANDWYAAAQLWAVQHDISDGTAPEAPITREQLAAMLYRYAQRKGLVRAAAYADLSGFADAASVSAYTGEALQWAVANGILTGMDGKLCPQGNATRAQVAQILYRLCEKWDLLAADNTAAIASAIYFAEDPEHTHSWTYTSNQNGTHSATCACGETKETERCTLAEQSDGSWKCTDCGFTVAKKNAVSTWEELNEAINGTEKKSEIYLVADIALKAPLDMTIYGCNRALTFAEDYTHTGAKRMIGSYVLNVKLTLNDLIFDGENKENDIMVVIDAYESTMTVSGCEFKNFKGTQIIHSRQNATQAQQLTILNTKIHDNTLTGVDSADKKGAPCVILLDNAQTEMTNVSITNNTTEKGTRTNAKGLCQVIFANDSATSLVANGLTITGNKAGVFQTNATAAGMIYRFESGIVEDNTGGFWVTTDFYVGKDMTITCTAEMDFVNVNNRTKSTLTNDGTITGNLVGGQFNRGDTLYTGTGTHTGTKTNIQDLTGTP